MNVILDAFIAGLNNGDHDDNLDTIIRACNERRRQTAYVALHQLKPGDRVVFTGGRPRYLIGHQATVVEIKQTYAGVRLDQPIGKFGTGVINTPMTLIKKVKS